MIKLSILVPGIRTQLWHRLASSISSSCTERSFEIIFCGPSNNDSFNNIENIKYIKDFGCPSRALQIASLVAEGEYITYTSDDCVSRPKSLDNIINNITSDIVSLQYSESPGFLGGPHPIEYYNAWHHSDLRCKHVHKSWKIPIIFLMKTELFYRYGGLDCRFEHINMNLHDMAFRMQLDNNSVQISKDVVWDADYVHRNDSDPVISAFKDNDKPLFDSIWNNESFDRNTIIDINNWKNSPNIWKRRFQ